MATLSIRPLHSNTWATVARRRYSFQLSQKPHHRVVDPDQLSEWRPRHVLPRRLQTPQTIQLNLLHRDDKNTELAGTNDKST